MTSITSDSPIKDIVAAVVAMRGDGSTPKPKDKRAAWSLYQKEVALRHGGALPAAEAEAAPIGVAEAGTAKAEAAPIGVAEAAPIGVAEAAPAPVKPAPRDQREPKPLVAHVGFNKKRFTLLFDETSKNHEGIMSALAPQAGALIEAWIKYGRSRTLTGAEVSAMLEEARDTHFKNSRQREIVRIFMDYRAKLGRLGLLQLEK